MPSANTLRAIEIEAQNAELEAQVLAMLAARSAPCRDDQPPPSAPAVEDFRAPQPLVRNTETTSPERDRKPTRTEMTSASGGVQDADLSNIHRLLLAQQVEIQMLKEVTGSVIDTKPRPPTPPLEVKPGRVESELLDLVVVLACTKSTRSWIDTVKSSIATVLNVVRADRPNAEIRLGLVAYPTLQTHPLTKYIDSVCDFVSSLLLEDAECKPGDTAEGLKKAIQMAFVARRRRIVLIADASHRGSIKMNSTAKGGDIPELMHLLAQSGIDFTLIEVENTGLLAAMLESEYTGVKLDDGIKNDFFRATLASFGGMNCLRSSVIASFKSRKPEGMIPVLKPVIIPSVVSVTPAAPVSLEKEVEPITVRLEKAVTRRLDWSELVQTPEVDVVRHSLHVHTQTGVEIDWANPELKHVTQKVKVRLLPTSFDRGSTRAAHAFYDSEMEKCCVAKFFIDPATISASILNEQAQRLAVAQKLAAEFALNLEGKGSNAAEGMIPCWYELKNPALVGLAASMTMFTVEPYVLSNIATTEDEQREVEDRAQAFSHFTWQKTLGTLMIVDRHGAGSVFRNPVIHSLREGTFGTDDLASAGMDSFFTAHVCNADCRAWNLASVKDESGQVKSKFLSSEAVADPSPSTLSIPPPRQFAEITERDTPMARPFVVYSCQLCGNIPRVLHTQRQDSDEKGVFCEVCAAEASKTPEPRRSNEDVSRVSAYQEDTSMAGSCEDEDNPRLLPPGEDAGDWAVVGNLPHHPD